MTTKKISALTGAALPLTGAELMELSQLTGGALESVQASSADVAYSGAKFGSFYDITDQTGSTSAATAVKFGTNDINGHGISIVSSGGNATRITYAAAGVYMVAPSLQFANSDTTNHNATVWLAKNGTAVPASATIINVPKAADGGVSFFQLVFYITLTAGQYVEIMWLPSNVAVTIDYTAAGAIAPSVPSAIVVSERIAL